MTQLPRLFGVRMLGIVLAVAAAPAVRAEETPPAPAEAPAPGAPAPEAPSTPAPEAPAPGAPAAPATPEAPAPGAPAPEAPAPAAPGAPAPETPAAPGAPAPEMPAAPGTPAAPGMPAAPGAEAPAAPGAPAPGAAPAAEAPVDQTLKQNVSNFWHYVMIARYDLGAAQARQLLTRDTKELLVAMEAEAKQRGTDQDAFLLQKQQVEPLKEVVTQLKQKLEEARAMRRAEPGFIEDNIKKLSEGERAYANALTRLRQSGELAVPPMVEILRDDRQVQYHPGIRRALRDMGRSVLNPLVAATEMQGHNPTVVVLADILADIPFTDVVPYLARIAQDKDASPVLRSAVSVSMQRMGADPRTVNPADQFLELASRFYYGTAGIRYDSRNPVAYYWYWDSERNALLHKDVPTAVFNDVMAMRCCEMALKLNSSKDPAGLWLAANNKREVDLKEGEKSGVFEDTPAHFWNVRLGTNYCNDVLGRALHDRNAAVALKVIKSMQEIVGHANLFGMVTDSPLLDGLRYGDRIIRYESAIAIGSALPQRQFAGQDRVVLLLAEAVSQTGTGGVLVLAPDEPTRQQITGDLKGYTVASAITADAAIGEAATLPSVDAIVISEQADPVQVQQLMKAASASPRMERAARIILAKNPNSLWFRTAMGNPTLSATVNFAADALGKAVEQGRAKAGGPPLDEKAAADFSLRSASLLARLAVVRGQVLDLATAEPTLLGSLNDKRPETVKAVASVLAQLDSQNTQPALLDKAVDDKAADDVRVPLLKALSQSAKLYGDRLDAGRIDKLRKAMQSNQQTPDFRSAAAEASGALNLPVEQIRSMILNRGGAPAAPAPAPAAAPAPAPGPVSGK